MRLMTRRRERHPLLFALLALLALLVALPARLAGPRIATAADTVETEWRLQPRGEGSNWVLFEIHLDPGGGLPDWMANARIVSTPLEALQNLRRMTTDSAAA